MRSKCVDIAAVIIVAVVLNTAAMAEKKLVHRSDGAPKGVNPGHVMTPPALQQVAEMEQNDDIKKRCPPGLGYLAFNTEKKPFDNSEVRQVLRLAIDANLDEILRGEGQVPQDSVPPQRLQTDELDKPARPSLSQLKDRLTKALQKDAFYRDREGFDTEIWVTPTRRLYNLDVTTMAERIQTVLFEIDVRTRIVSYEWAEYCKRSKAGDHQMILLGFTADNTDPGSCMLAILDCDAAKSGDNRTRWCHTDFDKHLKKGEIKQALEIFRAEAPMVAITPAEVVNESQSQTSDKSESLLPQRPLPLVTCPSQSSTPDRDTPKK